MKSESVVLAITDVHAGKRTKSFNMDIAEQRMVEIAERIESVLGHMKHGYDFDEIHLLFLGDLVDGSGIYPTQGHHQEETNPDQQTVDVAERLFVPFVHRMKANFPKVKTHFVPGNHGRVGKFAHEAANWDIACYRYMTLLLRGVSGIECITQDMAQPIKVVNIRGHGHLLYHGNEIRSFASIPWYGMMNRLMRWRNSSLPPWQIAHMGHFHSCGRWRINQFEMFSHGTMVTHDEWAFQVLGWESSNRWWLMGVSDDRPVTWAFDIDTAEKVVAFPGELSHGADITLTEDDDEWLNEVRGEIEDVSSTR